MTPAFLHVMTTGWKCRQISPNHTDHNIFKDPSASPSWEVMYINVQQVRLENDDLIPHLFRWCHIIICLFLLIVALSCSSSQKTIDTNHGKSSPSGVVAFGQYPLVLTCKDHEPRIADTDLFWYARENRYIDTIVYMYECTVCLKLYMFINFTVIYICSQKYTETYLYLSHLEMCK